MVGVLNHQMNCPELFKIATDTMVGFIGAELQLSSFSARVQENQPDQHLFLQCLH